MPWFADFFKHKPQVMLYCSTKDFMVHVCKLVEIACYLTYDMQGPGARYKGVIFRNWGAPMPITVYNTMLMMGVLVIDWGTHTRDTFMANVVPKLIDLSSLSSTS